MSYAYTDGQGREIWENSGVGLLDLVRGAAAQGRGYTTPAFSKEDQKLLEQGLLYKDTSRYSGKTAPVLTLEEKNQGYRWEQVGSRTVPTVNFRITHGAGKGGISPTAKRTQELPVWQKVGGSQAAADDTPAAPFAPSAALVAAKERAQTYQASGGSGSSRTPNFDLSGGALFNELWAQGASQNEDYQRRFIPQLQANALLNSAEVGEAGRYHLGRFKGKVEDIGDARASFNYYYDRVKA